MDIKLAPLNLMGRKSVIHQGCIIRSMRFFNTAGPMVPEENYCISPLDRLDRNEVFNLIEQKRYFILHAPRQTGKTSTLFALQDELNKTGYYRAVYTNVEAAQTAREDVQAAMQVILDGLGSAAEDQLNDSFVYSILPEILSAVGGHGALRQVLRRWSAQSSVPLVWMVDEIDALIGDTLISVLRQLRTGYAERPSRFPQTVILCGIRDVRDYRINASSEKEIISGGSAFNIKAKSLRLGDFDESDTRALLLQHTDEYGQKWGNAALQEVWQSTRGQPWLVNALASEVVNTVEDRNQQIEVDDIHTAREALIRRRDTHLDQLADKLREDRVKRVIEPLLSGESDNDTLRADDVQYVRDLGLISLNRPVEIANEIYREIIPRELITSADEYIPFETAWFVENGKLITKRLMESFQIFFREHSEHWVRRFDYQEAGPQLLLQAFLQRVVNSGGRVEREYGVGRKRTDLLIVWGKGNEIQKSVIECKLRKNGLKRTVDEGLEQIAAYMDICGTDDGHLIIFDRSKKRSWEEKVFRQQDTVKDKRVAIWGM